MFPLRRQSRLIWALYLTLQARVIFTGATNCTIDDEYGDELTGMRPTYLPTEKWTQGKDCEGCGVHLDPTRTLGGTWHDATASHREPRRVTAQFNGTAVYVFCSLVNQGFVGPGVTIQTVLSFEIDGAHVDDFFHPPQSTGDVLYNFLVYKNQTLADGPHTIVIKAHADRKGSPSLILFDYIAYTTTSATSTCRGYHPSGHPLSPAPPPPGIGPSPYVPTPSDGPSPAVPASSDDTGPKPQTHVNIAIGGALGGAAALALCIILFCALRSRRLQRRRAQPPTAEDGPIGASSPPHVPRLPPLHTPVDVSRDTRSLAWWEVGWGYSKSPSIFARRASRKGRAGSLDFGEKAMRASKRPPSLDGAGPGELAIGVANPSSDPDGMEKGALGAEWDFEAERLPTYTAVDGRT